MRILLVVTALVAVAASAIVPAAAQTGSPSGDTHAGGAEPSIESLRVQADAIATRYFAALARSRQLDDEIARASETVAALEAEAATAKENARDRALIAYRQSGSRLSAVIDGADVLDAARRARLIEQVNERDHITFITLRAVSKELQDERRVLEDARASQRQVAGDLQTQAAAIDAKLAEAARRDEIERAAAAAALTPAATSAPPTAPDTAPPSGTPSSAPPGAGNAPAPPPPAAPVNPGTPGVHPRHDDPFLACVRQRESGGNYGAVNSAGPYLGAYQFLQTTWNSTANHARRTELVGVAPNAASAYDQDDMAWTLYQWQGAGPWGGSCG